MLSEEGFSLPRWSTTNRLESTLGYEGPRSRVILCSVKNDVTNPHILETAACLAAGHQSEERFAPPWCYPQTRTAVIDSIMSWVNADDPEKKIMWLNGPPGAGKSAIAQTVAEKCHEENKLLSSFFFSHRFRNNGSRLVPTIAYHLMIAVPEAKSFIEDALRSDPAMFSYSMDEQMRYLVEGPLERHYATTVPTGTPCTPQLVIIDGLDECHKPNVQFQSLILSMIAALTQRSVRLRFLITSRPKWEIRKTLDSPTLNGIYIPLMIDKPYEDIEIYIRSEFSATARTHVLGKYLSDWPTQSDIRSLVERSSGKFINASRDIKFIVDPRGDPKDRLKIILNESVGGMLAISGTTFFDENMGTEGSQDESDDNDLTSGANMYGMPQLRPLMMHLTLKELVRDISSNTFSERASVRLAAFLREARRFLLKTVLPNRIMYRKLLLLEQHNAQLVLDLMQMVLDDSIVNSNLQFERSLLKAMLRLSKKSTLYPSSYVLSGIRRDEYPKISGGYGEIFEGDLNGRKLSLKAFKLYSSQLSQVNELLQAFYKEAILWRHLYHPNLLPFYGIYKLGDSGGRVCLVSPWMTNGNICKYLQQHPDTNRRHLVADIANGLAYIHEKSIVHGDLKGVNVLINDDGVACLADFGLSSIFAETPSLKWASINSTVSNTGTPRWQAPELLEGPEKVGATKESDIYAFACVCYEVFTGKIPFYEVPHDITAVIKVINGDRPPRPKNDSPSYINWGLTDWMWSLIEECWEKDPASRPKASEVIAKLSSREGFSRAGNGIQESWGELRPEIFRSLLGKDAPVSNVYLQETLSVLISLV